MDKAKRNRRMRERWISIREMPVLHEFKEHPLRPRFTMERPDQLSVNAEFGGHRYKVGVIERKGNGEFMWSLPLLMADRQHLDDLLALGESVYDELRAKYERKQEREKGQF